jgi:double-strand break repair protein MRE11
VRGDDSWKTFHEVMCLAKERDVDMVLLAGDLFHENKPSRKSMYQVMRSLRMNCYGEKPCELEMLSDASEQFAGAFNHVNYEDPDINVAIPVFSIHGNHDDPSGEGHLAALDILQMSGLVNYYGRTPESDNIQVKPVLLQKGQTKLALFGLSNVRDERLFRSFRDGAVKFFRPNTATDEWFNILSVHQNHHAYTETGYLPEALLPDFMDLVVWGHEHECKIEPTLNPEKGFKVMQPGSSVATSLALGEEVPKHVAILSVTGKDFATELVRLKTVRPFVYKEVILQNDKKMRELALQSADNQPAVNRYCMDHIDEMIVQANQNWLEAQQERGDEEPEEDPPLPLIRLRVEYTAPEGGAFTTDNPQRFSGRYVGKVANTTDIIQFHRKKASATRRKNVDVEMPVESSNDNESANMIKVDQLVREYLAAQTLTILPQNRLGDAVVQYVDKDDKHALEETILDSLGSQVSQLLGREEEEEDKNFDEETVAEMMENIRAQLEERFDAGDKALRKRRNRHPKPDDWDSEMDGSWEDDLRSVIRAAADNAEENDDDDEEASVASRAPAIGRGRGRGRGGRAAASTTTARKPAAKKAAPKATAPAKTPARSRKRVQESESEEEAEESAAEESDNLIMLDDDDDDDNARSRSPGLFMTQDRQPTPTARKPAAKPASRVAPAKKPAPAAAKSTAKKATPSAARVTQSQLNFSQPAAASRGAGRKRVQEPSDDEIDDDDDAFEPPPPSARTTIGRR